MRLLHTDDYVALDLETTGLSPRDDRIIEIGAVKYTGGRRGADFSCFVNPRIPIPARITEITGIDDAMVKDAPVMEEVLGELLDFIGELPVLGHNIAFDYGFICQKALNMKIKYRAKGIDTHRISRSMLPQLESRSLESLCGYYHIVEEPRHRALSDAAAAARLYYCLYEEAAVQDIEESSSLFMPADIAYTVREDAPATARQTAFLSSLIRRYRISFDKELETLTKSQASKEIDKILSTYGRQPGV